MRVLCAPVSDKERSWKKGGEEKKEEMPLMASTLKVALAWMALQIDQSRAHARVHPAVLLPVEEGQESWRKQKRENRRLEQLSQVESCAGPSASKTRLQIGGVGMLAAVCPLLFDIATTQSKLVLFFRDATKWHVLKWQLVALQVCAD